MNEPGCCFTLPRSASHYEDPEGGSPFIMGKIFLNA